MRLCPRVTLDRAGRNRLAVLLCEDIVGLGALMAWSVSVGGFLKRPRLLSWDSGL
jgi:hypothetical protein